VTAEPAPPPGLSDRAGAFWAETIEAFDMEAHDLEVLRAVVRLMDRADQLATAIDQGGLTVTGSAGQPRPNPLLAEERQTAATIARLLRELGLPASPAPDPRIPRR
jgi:hypothetical protein